MFKKIIMNPVIQLCSVIVMVAFITFMSVTEFRSIRESKQLSYMEQLAIQHMDYERTSFGLGQDEIKKYTPWGHGDIKCVSVGAGAFGNNVVDMKCYPVIEDFRIGNKDSIVYDGMLDTGREWTPMPRTVGDLNRLTKKWTDQYGEYKMIDVVEKLGVLLISPKYDDVTMHPPKDNLHD